MIRRVFHLALAGVVLGVLSSAGGCYQEISRTDKGLYVPSLGTSGSTRNLYREDSKVQKPASK